MKGEKYMPDENIEGSAVAFVNVDFTLYKNAIGSALAGGEFEFALLDESGTQKAVAENTANGLIKFNPVPFTKAGEYDYTLKELSAPDGWDADKTEYPVHISVKQVDSGFAASVSYSDGTPGFRNYNQVPPCSIIQFSALSFDKPGVYEYTLKELTQSGNGWETDNSEIKVIVTVTDDGYGNLVATVDYPSGYPEFTNTYKPKPAVVTISAIKKAIGAQLPCGKFEFGLFDEDGSLVFKAKNGIMDV